MTGMYINTFLFARPSPMVGRCGASSEAPVFIGMPGYANPQRLATSNKSLPFKLLSYS